MIGLYLMTEKGWKVISALIQRGFKPEIAFVVSSRDSNVQKDYFVEIASVCKEAGVPFYEKSSGELPFSEYAIAISWRWMLPVTQKLIVLHDSLLPRYRGFAPLVNYLINGEEEIGVTALFANGDFDSGDIIEKKGIKIQYPIKISQAIQTVSEIYVELILNIFSKLKQGNTLHSDPQDHSQANYSLWLDEEDYRIQWSSDAKHICRFIDATGFPYKGAYALIKGKMVRIQSAAELNDVEIVNRVPGKVLFVRDNKPVVVCGKGLVQITSMVWDDDGTDALPLKQFRTRFT
jgi:methionyl-tRNA formyltransferase